MLSECDDARLGEAVLLQVVRISDRPDAVPDDLWNEVTQHYDEKALAALILSIALINVWNRLNVATKQVAGEWVKSVTAASA